jgi:hypothetical protein
MMKVRVSDRTSPTPGQFMLTYQEYCRLGLLLMNVNTLAPSGGAPVTAWPTTGMGPEILGTAVSRSVEQPVASASQERVTLVDLLVVGMTAPFAGPPSAIDAAKAFDAPNVSARTPIAASSRRWGRVVGRVNYVLISDV